MLISSALGLKINMTSFFDRKHYFLLTQHRTPLAVGGSLASPVLIADLGKEGYHGRSGIVQLQKEQDSDESLLDDEVGRSLVDLNR